MKINSIAAAAVIFAAQPAFAGDLMSPFNLDNAGVLPKGVRSVRITHLTSAIDSSLNGAGRPQGLAAEMNKTITFNDLAKSFEPGMDRASFKGYLISQGFSLDEAVGATHGVVNSRISGTVPIAAYGVNEKHTLAVAVPIITSDVNVATGWTPLAPTGALLTTLAGDGKYGKVLQNAPKLQNVIETQLQSKGYKPLRDQRQTQVGDTSLFHRYLAYTDPKWMLSVQSRLVLPTGRPQDIDNIVDVAGGDGQTDVGTGFLVDYFVSGRFILMGSASYLAQLPTQVDRRIPESADDRLTADKDRVRMDLGDMYSGTLGARYLLLRTLTIGATGALQYKGSDSYRGARFTRQRYRFLEQSTEQTLGSAVAAVTYSTVPLYLNKQFALPLEAAVNYATVLGGRNVKNNQIASFEMAVFF